MRSFASTARCLCLIAATVFILDGCATLFHGSTDTIDFSSEPSEAVVYVNGKLMGMTPLQLRLDARQPHTIEFRRDGYRTQSYVVNSSVGSVWIILDILGGGLPIIVDAATGDWHTLDQWHIDTVLEAQKKEQ
jgi:hypothetical protein